MKENTGLEDPSSVYGVRQSSLVWEKRSEFEQEQGKQIGW